MLRKYLLFAVIFSIAFTVLQIVSGLFLTMLYTPSPPMTDSSTLSSQVEFGRTSLIPQLILSLVALGITLGVTKLFNKKTVQY